MIDFVAVGKARKLAYFIHRHRDVAREVTASATARVGSMVTQQNRRCAYRPKKQRSKVALSSTHLLQYLVYRESEPFEKQQEENEHGQVIFATDDLLIRYIKHLVQISLRRNSFYVTLALCKFLYDYSTEETMAIYDLVTQDAGCRHEAYYFRSRKAVMLRELETRFGTLLARSRGARGALQIQRSAATPQDAELVRECLNRFTPWNTRCVIPEGFDPWQELPDLCCVPGTAEQDDRTEVNRIHAVLHPECLTRLTRALGLEPPENRLKIPRFFAPSLASANEVDAPALAYQRPW
ncbi:MAG: hypothetical protein AAF657_22765 [Acidobacteriota bacterium]